MPSALNSSKERGNPCSAPWDGRRAGTLALIGVIAALSAFARPAHAQEPAALGASVVPPRLLEDSPAVYPEALGVEALSGEVELELLVDEEGDVAEVEVSRAVHPLLDEAAVDAARGLRFEPATLDGKPVAVKLHYSYRFEVAPPPAPAPAPQARRGVLEGRVRSMGTRDPVVGAHLSAGDVDVQTDAEGRFRLELPEGEQRIAVEAAGFRDGAFPEKIEGGRSVEVVYALEPRRVNPYETVVHGERERTELSRVSLERNELREVPGTMGDPFRVVMLLPGVGSVLSGVAYPVVRGSTPASTGYFLDGIRVPVLYHLFLGPAVIHPDFMDGIDFFPGAPPPRYGRLLGGVIDGKVSSPRDDRLHATAYADLINTGGFLEVPIAATGTNLTAAGRVSYTPWLIALMANSRQSAGRPDYVLDFWDYQARLEQKIGRARLRLFGFGSSDRFGTESEDPDVGAAAQAIAFHRIDARLQTPAAGGELELGATVGADALGFHSQDLGRTRTDFNVDENSLAARATWRSSTSAPVRLVLGGDVDHRAARIRLDDRIGLLHNQVDAPLSVGTFAGAWSQLVVEGAGWTVVPGLRFDNYHLVPGIDRAAVEPRLTLRKKLGERVALKAAAGLYHQQPTTLIQLPVVDVAGLRYGLQEAAQLGGGLEWTLPGGLELTADVYYNPLLRTFELNPFDPEIARAARFGSFDQGLDTTQVLAAEDVASKGRAYGLELMVRRPLGRNWFGWLSYSLQRSTREVHFNRYGDFGQVVGQERGYLPYVFDQTHIFNGVLSWRLPGNWTLGAVLHFNTGRPESGVMTSHTLRQGVDTKGNDAWVRVDRDQVERLPPFLRLDLRLGRTWVFDDFLLDGYLDLLNATFAREIIGYTYAGGIGRGGGPLEKRAQGVPVVLPILGIKASY